MRHSLKTRLLTLITAVVALVLTVAGASVYWAISRSLLASFDKALVDEAIALSTLIEIGDNGVQSEITEHGHDPFQVAQRTKYYEVLSTEGVLLERSLGLGDARLPDPGVEFDLKQLHIEHLRDIVLANGQPGRQLVWDFLPSVERDLNTDPETDSTVQSQIGARLVLAKDMLDLDEDLANLRYTLLLVLGVTAAISAPAVWLVAAAALRPLSRVAEQISRVDPNDLSSPISLEEVPVETQKIVDRLNELLARLKRAFEQERSFSANVAHELRTPVAGLRANIEMILAAPREPHDYEATLEKCLRITLQTEAVVNTLLTLSRADARQLSVDAEAFQIGDVLHRAWEAYSQPAGEKQLTIQWLVDEELWVWADESCVTVILRNLFDNATSYTDVGGNICISTQATESAIAIQVENTGCQLTADQMSKVGQRFWRGDASRAATGRHAGLGLALSIELAALQGGKLELSWGSSSRFKATLRLPKHQLSITG